LERKHTLILCLLTALGGAGGYGAPADDPFGALTQPSSVLDNNTPIEVDADQLDYDKASGRITATGNVVIICGLDELRADQVLVNINSGDAYALGNVILSRGDAKTYGTKLQYNFRTRVCSLDDPEVDASPFRVIADRVTRAGQNEYVLHKAKVTTCVFKYPHCHYHIRARRITVVPGEYMKTRGGVWFFGPVPCMYMPYWYRDLATDAGFRFYPGYRSKMGGYLLSSYYHRLAPNLRAEHHVDYRSRRGVALGEDLKWNAPNVAGALKLYYLDDKAPNDDDEDPTIADIDSQRYRIHLQHDQTFDERTLMLVQLSYLSDTDLLEDFFDSDYRVLRQPENHVTLSHRRDTFTVTALANSRLNDFYGNVNRLPEVSVDFLRLQLGRSSFYYEGQTVAAQLGRVWPEGSAEEDYASLRMDTAHMLYQPRRYFGWLNLVPRAGYRGTYYSASLDSQTFDSVETLSSTNTTVEGGITNTVITTTFATNTTTSVTETGAKLRNLFEVGAELSFKAFKVLDPRGAGLRHVVEPHANYTLRLEPNVLPDALYQFDNVDTLGELHEILLGVRNKIQTKSRGRPFDLVDVDTFVSLRLNAEGDQEVFERLYVDAEFRPTEWLSLDLDGAFNAANSELEQFNTRVDLLREALWTARVEHRYRLDDSNLLAGTLTFYPSAKWAFNVFGRYEFEASRVEEQGGSIERELDCIGLRLGGSVLPGFTRTDGTEKDIEYRVMLEFWLTAFPEVSLRTKNRY